MPKRQRAWYLERFRSLLRSLSLNIGSWPGSLVESMAEGMEILTYLSHTFQQVTEWHPDAASAVVELLSWCADWQVLLCAEKTIGLTATR